MAPAGNPVSPGTVIQSSWANTLVTDIGNTFNNTITRDGQGVPTAPIKFVDGTVTVPGITFNGSSSTGLYRPGTDKMAMTVSGVEALRVNSSGHTMIGTTTDSGSVLSVGGTMTVTGATTLNGAVTLNGSLIGSPLQAGNTPNGYIQLLSGGPANSGYLGFFSAAGNRQGYIGFSSTDTTGNTGTIPYIAGRHAFTGDVGVGLTPSTWAGLTNGALEVGAAGNGFVSNGSGNFIHTNNAIYNSGWKYATSGLATTYSQSTGGHYWATAASGTAGNSASFVNKMILDSSGNLGIGATPTTRLQVGTGSVAGLDPNVISIGSYSTNTDQYKLVLNHSSTGMLGIGVSAANNMIFGLASGYTGAVTTNWMTLDTNGNLGIGVTPATATRTTLQIGAYGTIDNNGGTGIEISSNAAYNSGWKYINTAAATQYYQTGGTHVWQNAISGTAGNPITFTQAMTLDSSGNLSLIGNVQQNNATYLQGKTSGAVATRLFGLNGSNNLYVGSIDAAIGNTLFVNAGFELMTLNSSGNLGIGSSPIGNSRLTIASSNGSSTNGTIALTGLNTSAQLRLMWNNTGSVMGIGSDASGGMIFGRVSSYDGVTGLSTHLTLDTGGNLNINGGSGKLLMNGGITRFESSQITPVASVNYEYSVSHGGPRKPDIIRVVLRCLVGDWGFAAGDEINITDYLLDSNRAYTSGSNASKIWLLYQSATSQIPTIRARSDGQVHTITSASYWAFVFYAHWL